VRKSGQTAVLADAAAVLSGQFRSNLHVMASLLAPRAERLARRYQRRLRELRFTRQHIEALVNITSGAAAQQITLDGLSNFLEQVQYLGRRLAKLGLTPSQVLSALREYDLILEESLTGLSGEEAANLNWIRDQLQFCVVLTLNNAFYQVREAESHAFYELFRVEVESRSLGEMLERFLATLVPFTGADAGALYLLDDQGGGWHLHASMPAVEAAPSLAPLAPQLRRRLLRPRCFEPTASESFMAIDPAWRDSASTCWSIPLLEGSHLRGLMQFAFNRPYEWLPREHELLAAAAERCWMAAQKARLMEDLARREDQVRRLAEHMVAVEESERRRISRELHDEAGQSLLCVRLQLEMIEQDLPDHSRDLKRRMAETREQIEHSIIEIRRLIAALSPSVLDQMGLAAGLRQLLQRFRDLTSIKVEIDLPRRLDLPKRIELITYRLVQEICNNIAKYSQARHVNLSLSTADSMLKLRVLDDGIGFDVAEAFNRRDCFGLSGLRERVALLGGSLEIQSRKVAAGGSGNAPGRGSARQQRKQREGQVGVDRAGTAISINLPLPAGPPPRPSEKRTAVAGRSR